MKKVGILGISGYTGLELLKILNNHPKFEVCYLANTSGEGNIYEIFPSLINVVKNMPIQKINFDKIEELDLVFLALPHTESMKIVPKILESKTKVVDLSADYRLSESNFNLNYSKHLDSTNLENAIYGLIEWNRENIKNASLIANPGCYPTASLLGILPFIRYLGDKSIFIDAKSGVSGAGKKLSDNTHYPNINDNIFSYSPLSHRHQIEISEKISIFGKEDIKVNFIPHLSPFTRGMLVSMFAKLKEEVDVLNVLKDCYQNEFFIRIKDNPVDVKSVSGTHFCDIFAKNNGADLFISVSIDNLLRGASSQAVVNANLIFGFDETLGIPKIAYVP